MSKTIMVFPENLSGKTMIIVVVFHYLDASNPEVIYDFSFTNFITLL